eukprot:TRINITY_DN32553_c0_g1_i1.p1 TRINITY_DN32553_c0_g1~~TRINITY_DN32553_c0_g1_i1.p1  ORF type:complete len:312 (+),score=50.51 TRINITY_DN32553_c0_g1_i1:39-974(+)
MSIMACCVFLGLLVLLPLGYADACGDACSSYALDATVFLQTGMNVHKGSQQCGRLVEGCYGNPLTSFNNNEICHTNRADFSKSIVEVMRENPGKDGFCHFNASAMYILYTGSDPDYVVSATQGILGLRAPTYMGLNTGPPVTYHWEGETVFSHADCSHYVYDDLYGFFLGALQNQGMDTAALSDPKAWEEISRHKCEQIQAEYQFKDDELIFNDILDMNMPIFAGCYCAAGIPLSAEQQADHYVTDKAGYHSPSDCKPVSKREFARHHYMKCVLGYKNSAADIAYLHARACLLPGNIIGHFSECPYSPPGV